MTTEYKKPLPYYDHPAVSRPFWEAAKRHELVMPRCKHCHQITFYPREVCPFCHAQEWEWPTMSGKGVLYAYTVVYQPGHPAFQEDAPYIFAIVQLDEGPRMPSNIVGVDAEDFMKELKIGIAVVATYDDVTPEVTLVKFRPA